MILKSFVPKPKRGDTMKTIMILCAASLAAVLSSACAAGPGESEDEPTSADSAAYVSTGFCEASADGFLTGRCRSGASMCCAKPSDECAVGAPAGPATVLRSMCGTARYDRAASCRQYC